MATSHRLRNSDVASRRTFWRLKFVPRFRLRKHLQSYLQVARYLLVPRHHILVAFKGSFLLYNNHPSYKSEIASGSNRALSINLLPFSIACRCSSTKRMFPTKYQYKRINPWNKYTTIKCCYKTTMTTRPSPNVLPLLKHCYRVKVRSYFNKRPSKL